MRMSTAFTAVVLTAAVVVSARTASAQDDRYLLLATQRTGTMQQEINDAAGKGFRVVAASRTEGTEVIVLLEQTKDKYQYRLLATTRTGTLQREISEAADAGYRVVPRAVTTKRTSGGLAGLAGNNRNEGELLVLMEKGPEGPGNAQYQVLATERTGTLQREIGQAAINGYMLVALTSRGEHVAILERGVR
jgi:hypothetical protein